MLELDIKNAHRMVREQRMLGNNVRWDGWDIVFFRKADHGMYSSDGAFRDGAWGFENRFPVSTEGIWSIDKRNIKSKRRR